MENNVREINQYDDFPYTMIGHTSLTPSFSMFMSGKGLKEIVKLMRDGEDLRITVSDQKTKFEVVDTHNKYADEKSKINKVN